MHLKLLTVIVLIQIISNCYGYYWRDYNGKLPLDAIEAGTSANNQKVYIGQALITTDPAGIYVGAIQESRDVFVPIFGVKKAENFIQILCGNDPDNFYWLPSNSSNFHLLNTDYTLIRGGIEDNNWLNIGRVKYQGGTAVGKILAGSIENAEMWFAHNEKEIKTNTYEVLVYNDVSAKINSRSGI